MVVAEADPPQGQRLAGFLEDRPSAQIKANIVPKIADQMWAKGVFAAWEKDDEIIKPVKSAIKQRRGNGNISVK